MRKNMEDKCQKCILWSLGGARSGDGGEVTAAAAEVRGRLAPLRRPRTHLLIHTIDCEQFCLTCAKPSVPSTARGSPYVIKLSYRQVAWRLGWNQNIKKQDDLTTSMEDASICFAQCKCACECQGPRANSTARQGAGHQEFSGHYLNEGAGRNAWYCRLAPCLISARALHTCHLRFTHHSKCRTCSEEVRQPSSSRATVHAAADPGSERFLTTTGSQKTISAPNTSLLLKCFGATLHDRETSREACSDQPIYRLVTTYSSRLREPETRLTGGPARRRIINDTGTGVACRGQWRHCLETSPSERLSLNTRGHRRLGGAVLPDGGSSKIVKIPAQCGGYRFPPVTPATSRLHPGPSRPGRVPATRQPRPAPLDNIQNGGFCPGWNCNAPYINNTIDRRRASVRLCSSVCAGEGTKRSLSPEAFEEQAGVCRNLGVFAGVNGFTTGSTGSRCSRLTVRPGQAGAAPRGDLLGDPAKQLFQEAQNYFCKLAITNPRARVSTNLDRLQTLMGEPRTQARSLLTSYATQDSPSLTRRSRVQAPSPVLTQLTSFVRDADVTSPGWRGPSRLSRPYGTLPDSRTGLARDGPVRYH
ncbi:hypothetical protein Bbelb_208660 [Branchiostoma belcheri]|nr:hypothetical protein Bbelb_208660 [Branchiostoma belcheri]